MAEKHKSPAKAAKDKSPAKLAEYKYIGDDGGRWVFERRSDKRVVTITKPKALPDKNPSQLPVQMIVHGFRVNDDVIALCKK
jgi:hypothetical protein